MEPLERYKQNLLEEVRRLSEAVRGARGAEKALLSFRDTAIAEAARAGVLHSDMVRVVGVNLSRIGQIVKAQAAIDLSETLETAE